MAMAQSERRASISSVGAPSTDTPPRLSVDKRHSIDRRLSSDSAIRTPLPNLPGVSTLPGLSSNSPLIAGGAMAPPIPPKDRLPPPMTPTRKPVQRQKSPLSSEAFSSASPASVMPGAFPTSPSPGATTGQLQTVVSAGDLSPTGPPSPIQQNRHAERRSSGLRNFFPFKALRRSYFSSTSVTPAEVHDEQPTRPSTSLSFRPSTPSTDRKISGEVKPNFHHKVSGTLWKRKSSLGVLDTGAESPGGPNERGIPVAQNGTTSPTIGSPKLPQVNGVSGSLNNANGNGILHEDGDENGDENGFKSFTYDERPSTPTHRDSTNGMPKPRKSGTFWRRGSGMNALDGDKMGWTIGGRKASMDVTRKHNGKAMNGGPSEANGSGLDDGSNAASTMEVPIVLRRSHSPPPQLPPLVGGGDGFGDIFKDFH